MNIRQSSTWLTLWFSDLFDFLLFVDFEKIKISRLRNKIDIFSSDDSSIYSNIKYMPPIARKFYLT